MITNFSVRFNVPQKLQNCMPPPPDHELIIHIDSPHPTSTTNSIKTSKYTPLNLIPKTLFEQFKRLANVYFLILSGLMMIGTYAPSTFDSPLTPYSTFFPLCVVLAFTMVKEAFEDFKRHKADGETDSRITRRVVGGEEVRELKWDAVKVGMVLRIHNKEAVPADVVVLRSSEPMGVCFVETSNIDGETNLKMKRVVAVEEGGGIDYVGAEMPNGRVHTFKGFAKLKSGDKVAVDESSFLVRGSSLQNVKHVDALVVYIGPDSKLAKNASKPRLKLSSIEKTMNRLIWMVLGWLFAMVFLATGMLIYTKRVKKNQFPYLLGSGDDFLFPTPMAFMFTFLILFSNALPMSLYITVEIVNFGQAYFISTDLEMYDSETNLPVRAVTSNLNSDLGQVEFIFSDKTGTLTKNVMTFRRCSVGGQVYGEPLLSGDTDAAAGHGSSSRQKENGDGDDQEQEMHGGATKAAVAAMHGNSSRQEQDEADDDQEQEMHGGATKSKAAGAAGHGSNTRQDQYGDGHDQHQGTQNETPFEPLEALSDPKVFQAKTEESKKITAFLECLAVAHTVQLEEDGSLRAESPDEKALCEGAALLGYSLKGRCGSNVEIENAGKSSTWTVLAVNDFSSSRKRMSVLLRAPNAKPSDGYVLFCKGADSVMFARAQASTDAQTKSVLDLHLNMFANDGLRTLILARRVDISEQEGNQWLEEFKAAKAVLENRDEAVEAVAEKIEINLEILGATAIEDQLQDGVPETLEALRAAGIRIWVLTGDKLETAINIGFSSSLLDSSMRLVRVDGKTNESVKAQLEKLTTLWDIKTTGAASSSSSSAAATSSAELPAAPVVSAAALHPISPRRTLADILATVARDRINRATRWWIRRGIEQNEEQPDADSDAGRMRARLLDESHADDGFEDAETGVSRASSASSLRGLEHNRKRRKRHQDDPLALAITGQALEFALDDPETKSLLLQLGLQCRVVLACRVSPKQKAEVVRMVKKGSPGESLGLAPVTLAIGDGANDVGMIQEAQVGVGISGKEGMQAVNASDFAISQFSYLKRLLLVHGRWSYRRMAKVVLYSLYKNLVLVLLLFYYQFFAAFSGVSLYESMVQAGYNFFLGMGPVALGLFDQEISAKFALQNPQLYVSGRRNLNLNVVKLGWRVVEAFVHSAIIFCLPVYAALTNGFAVPSECHSLKGQNHQAFGGTPDLYVLGVASFTCLIFVMHYKILFEASSFTVFNFYALVFSFTLYFGFLVVYGVWYWEAPEFYWVAFCALGRPALWHLVLICVISAFVFDSTVRLARLMFRPHPVDILIERDRLAQKLISTHERRKRMISEGHEVANDLSFFNGEGAGFGERVRRVFDVNRHELFERVQSLTELDLDDMGIDSPSLRSSFDFSVMDRLISRAALSSAVASAAANPVVSNGNTAANGNVAVEGNPSRADFRL